MDTKAIRSERFEDRTKQAEQTFLWRSTYDQLIAKLGALGTEVKRYRVLEEDIDIAPYRFVRKATHVFVFPPQPEATVEADNSGTVDPTPGYQLYREAVTWAYDSEQVRGLVQVAYDDSESRVNFSISDLLGNSELSDEALAAIDGINAAE